VLNCASQREWRNFQWGGSYHLAPTAIQRLKPLSSDGWLPLLFQHEVLPWYLQGKAGRTMWFVLLDAGCKNVNKVDREWVVVWIFVGYRSQDAPPALEVAFETELLYLVDQSNEKIFRSSRISWPKFRSRSWSGKEMGEEELWGRKLRRKKEFWSRFHGSPTAFWRNDRFADQRWQHSFLLGNCERRLPSVF